MRTIAAHLEMSLDGVVDSPERWAHAYFSPDLLEAAQAGMADTDTILFGRRTYEEFATIWPNQPADDPFAGFLNDTPKLVASNTLQELPWGPAELVTGDAAEAVAELKSKPGGDVIILGSSTLVGSLLRAGVLDMLELFIVPVLIGNGKRLFDAPDQVPLRLVESRSFDNGVLAVRYGRGQAPPHEGEAPPHEREAPPHEGKE
ncbi:MAG: dihydrofolate reductase family protein [Actinomycetota bacterium]